MLMIRTIVILADLFFLATGVILYAVTSITV